MTPNDVKVLIQIENRMWDGVFGFRSLDTGILGMWAHAGSAVVETIAPFLVASKSGVGYFWMPENDGDVVPILAAYREGSLKQIAALETE